MDGPTMALAACVGCGCAGGACLAPDDALPGPIAEVKAAVINVAGSFGFGSGSWR